MRTQVNVPCTGWLLGSGPLFSLPPSPLLGTHITEMQPLLAKIPVPRVKVNSAACSVHMND